MLDTPSDRVETVSQFPVHEIFHIFDSMVINRAGTNFAATDPILMGRGGLDNGYWQQNRNDSVLPGSETFADLGVAWTYNHYNPIPVLPGQFNYATYTMAKMNRFMEQTLIQAYYGLP
jgi:hypothetical protein